MATYHFQFQGRLVNASCEVIVGFQPFGIVYPCNQSVEADTLEEAALKLYETHDYISELQSVNSPNH